MLLPTDKYVSPSQLDTFHNICRRRWAYRKIDGLPEKPNRYAESGVRFHWHREQWLQFGTPPDRRVLEGRMARQGLDLLPLPKTRGMSVELPFAFEIDGVLYIGFIDVFVRQSAGGIWLIDHKSTSDFKWMKTPDKLTEDYQWIIYGMYAVLKGAKQVEGMWLYTVRKKPHPTKPSRISESADEICRKMARVHDDALELLDAYNYPSSKQPKNFNGCEAFGGCPYKETCLANETASTKFRTIMAQSLADKARAARQSTGATSKTAEEIKEEAVDRPDKAPEERKSSNKMKDTASEEEVDAAVEEVVAQKAAKKATKKKATKKSSVVGTKIGDMTEDDFEQLCRRMFKRILADMA